jgi:hypothetical protein
MPSVVQRCGNPAGARPRSRTAARRRVGQQLQPELHEPASAGPDQPGLARNRATASAPRGRASQAGSAPSPPAGADVVPAAHLLEQSSWMRRSPCVQEPLRLYSFLLEVGTASAPDGQHSRQGGCAAAVHAHDDQRFLERPAVMLLRRRASCSASSGLQPGRSQQTGQRPGPRNVNDDERTRPFHWPAKEARESRPGS